MNGRSDVAIDREKSIMTIRGLRLAGESETVECAIQPVSRAVAGEDAAGAVSSMGCGRKADNQKAGVQHTQTGNGLAPIFPILESPHFQAGDLFAVGCQSAAQPAIDDVALRSAATSRQGLAES